MTLVVPVAAGLVVGLAAAVAGPAAGPAAVGVERIVGQREPEPAEDVDPGRKKLVKGASLATPGNDRSGMGLFKGRK